MENLTICCWSCCSSVYSSSSSTKFISDIEFPDTCRERNESIKYPQSPSKLWILFLYSCFPNDFESVMIIDSDVPAKRIEKWGRKWKWLYYLQFSIGARSYWILIDIISFCSLHFSKWICDLHKIKHLEDIKKITNIVLSSFE